MKKNIAMRIAAVLFILTMLTTCAFATTFAKYTTSGSAEDSARVAKWGVTVVAEDADQLFANEYDGTVLSADRVDVVAPGTEGELAGFTVSGAPEVDVKVTYAAELVLSGWIVDGVDYCPIVITVNGTECKGATMAALKDAVEAAIAGQSKEYAANSPLADVLEVSWKWAYEGDDVKDTALGNLATAPTISLKVTCTVTQID